MEENIPHYKVVRKVPICPSCKIELKHAQSIHGGRDAFVCEACKKQYIIPSGNWGYVGILQ